MSRNTCSQIGIALNARVFATVLAAVLSVASPVLSQGVPVFDGSNLARNIEQLQAALRDAENQIQQIEELRRQIELQIEQITNLEGILGSISGVNEIAGLYNSARDIRDRAAKITDLSGFMDSLSIGDFDGLLASLVDADVTMGDRRAAEAMQETLSDAGFTPERLGALNAADDPQGAALADTAAANATVIAAAQLSYAEAGSSLARIDGLVAEIAHQETLKDSMDLNTRMAAETNYMLGQMWRLNAAQGLAEGQNGIDWAAEQARTRSFFDYTGAEE